jgi:GT2 family glycosyltransferase
MPETQAKDPEVSIVIPTVGRPGYLEHTLRSLTEQDARRPFEVLVAHDGRDPETREVVERFAGRLDVHYLPANGAPGPNAARNRGFAAARAGTLALIDDDVEAPPGWLAALVDGFETPAHPDVVGGPVVLRLEGFRFRTCGRERPPISSLDLGPDTHEVDEVWSCNMALSRRALETAGEFDEAAVYGEEEVEWQRRVRGGGGTVLYVAAAGLVHRRSAEDSRLGSLVRESYRRGRQLRRAEGEAGKRTPIVRELRVLAGCIAHVPRFRCANGVLLTAHSFGRIVEAAAHR